MRRRIPIAAAALLLAACADTPTEIAPIETSALSALRGAPEGVNCAPRALRDVQKGRITPGSCLIPGTDSRGILYAADALAADQMLTLTVDADFAGSFGIREATPDAFAGTIWGALNTTPDATSSFTFIGTSPELVYVRGPGSPPPAGFTLTAEVAPLAYECVRPYAIETPASFTMTLDDEHSCQGTIQFSPFPDAIGQPLDYHFFNARLEPGDYVIRVSGVSPEFNAVLTVYRNGEVVAQSVGEAPASGVREVYVTSTELGYFGVEVSSGQPDGMGGWITPSGTYTITIERAALAG